MSCLFPDVGMVVPVWYPADAAPELVDTLLRRTLDGAELHCRPEQVVLVLDGQERWQEAVRHEAHRRGFRYDYLPRNLGKGRAVAAGIRRLEGAGPAYIVTRDSDGDHLIHDMPPLLHLAEQMAQETGNPLLIVSGGRGDRTRPLGLERAEYEDVTDRVLWEALQYHAARAGRHLSGAYFAAYGDWPDLQSGYKVYSAAAAALAADVLESSDGASGDTLSRCGVETLPAVAILGQGGEVGVMARRTYQEQPVSGYRDVDSRRMYGEPLLWALRRLQLPLEAAAAMLDDALLRSRLLFDAPRRAKALAVRSLVLDGLGGAPPMRPGSRCF